MVEPSSGQLTFHDARPPVLESGVYEITVRQQVSGPATEQHPEAGPAAFTFEVNGPKYHLSPQDIVATYPMANADGDFSSTYAHVELGRATLPWERSAVAGARPAVPWLALLIFDADRVVEHAATPPGDVDAISLPQEGTGDQHERPSLLLRVKRGVLPASIDVLHSRSHVRSRGVVADEHAFIVSQHTLTPGAKVAHLVSLEDQYSETGTLTSNDEMIELVSLKSWRFTTEGESFVERFAKIGREAVDLVLPASGASEQAPGTEPLDHGHVPLEYMLRDGSQTYGWYRGPFVSREEAARGNQPICVQHSDQLLELDPRTGLINVSRAAAWELGRMLTLRNERVAVAQYQWKRELARQQRAYAQRATVMSTPGFDATIRAHREKLEQPPDLPVDVNEWMHALRQLRIVPFNYLVPDERMLPTESIRFFHVDADWIECLIDGAFSVGRFLAIEQAADAEHRLDHPDMQPHLAPAALSGFLLRSSVVSEWPDLVIEAENCTEVRSDRLAPDLLLMLFAGELAHVDFHVKPEALHLVQQSTEQWPGEGTSGAAFAANRESTGPRVRMSTGLHAEETGTSQ